MYLLRWLSENNFYTLAIARFLLLFLFINSLSTLFKHVIFDLPKIESGPLNANELFDYAARTRSTVLIKLIKGGGDIAGAVAATDD